NKDEPAVSDAKVKESFDKANLHIPIVRDLQKHTDQIFKVESLPTMVILGPDGTLQDYHLGFDADLAQTLPQKIQRLLDGESLAQEVLNQYQQAQQEYEKQLSENLAEGPETVSGGQAEAP